jgi:hypothetical protein
MSCSIVFPSCSEKTLSSPMQYSVGESASQARRCFTAHHIMRLACRNAGEIGSARRFSVPCLFDNIRELHAIMHGQSSSVASQFWRGFCISQCGCAAHDGGKCPLLRAKPADVVGHVPWFDSLQRTDEQEKKRWLSGSLLRPSSKLKCKGLGDPFPSDLCCDQDGKGETWSGMA